MPVRGTLQFHALKECQMERDSLKNEAKMFFDVLQMNLEAARLDPARQRPTGQENLHETVSSLQTKILRLKIELAHRNDSLESASRLRSANQTVQEAGRQDLMHALDFRTGELDICKKKLVTASAESIILQTELDLSRKAQAAQQGELDYIRRQLEAQLHVLNRRGSEKKTSSIVSSSSTLLQETATISNMHPIDKHTHERRSTTVTSTSPPSPQSPLRSPSAGSAEGVGEGMGEHDTNTMYANTVYTNIVTPTLNTPTPYGVKARVVGGIGGRERGDSSSVFCNHQSFSVMC